MQIFRGRPVLRVGTADGNEKELLEMQAREENKQLALEEQSGSCIC